ncbi:MAG TPA: YebC/PmpR family DNA-binding transcriptional regulator [Candidatus Paceibacterota bacterium]|nr:YebC/PmpR family DNA-binding transcriptional regulator [Candidatus Paceibacterota bacterium]
MAGHNKWSQIKRKKGASDAERSKLFGKLSRFIVLESKKAAGNVNSPSLRAAIDKARAFNMPSDNIERAIKKGTGGEAGGLEAILYEAYGPGGAALLIEALTGNRNKAASEIKHILSEHGTSLGGIGSAAWAFEKVEGEWRPKVEVPLAPGDEEKLGALIAALEENDEVQDVYTNAAKTDGE